MDAELLTRATIRNIEREMSGIRLAAAAERAKRRPLRGRIARAAGPRFVASLPQRLLRAARLTS